MLHPVPKPPPARYSALDAGLAVAVVSVVGLTNATQVSQAFDSIVRLATSYGFNGVSLDLEPSGSAWTQSALVDLAQRLVARYGSQFVIDVCVGLYGSGNTTWPALGRALDATMDHMSVMLYDFPEAADSRLSSVSKSKVDLLVAAGIPAHKIVLRYMMRPSASYANSTPSPSLVVDALRLVRQSYPTLLGYGGWEDGINAGRNWDGPRSTQAEV